MKDFKLVLLTVILNSCTTGFTVLDDLKKCKLAIELLGDNLEIILSRNIASAGVWMPPVKGCSFFYTISGSKDTAKVYTSATVAGECYHLKHHSGKMHKLETSETAIYNIVDLKTCTLMQKWDE